MLKIFFKDFECVKKLCRLFQEKVHKVVFLKKKKKVQKTEIRNIKLADTNFSTLIVNIKL